MFYDNRYDDNIVLRREAFQNLLTNIKNYPIIDVDFVEEYEKDNLHDNNIWKGFTHNTPCLKITYGDDRTTKGNAMMFANDGQKKRLYDNQQALRQLQIELNNRNYEAVKLRQALENNYYFLKQEKEQLKRIQSKVDFITSNKEVYLQAVLSVLLFPYAKNENDYFNFADIWGKDNHAGPLSKVNINFTYTQLPLKYKTIDENNSNENNSNPTEIDVILTYSQIYNFDRLLAMLAGIKDNKIIKNGEEVFNFNTNERNFIASFEDFIKAYNYLSLVDAFEKQGFTEEEIQSFQQENSTNNRLSQETLEIIRNKLKSIVEDEHWNWESNNLPDFQNMINLYKNNIENIVTKIIGTNNNDGIINYNIRRIQEQLDELNGDINTGTYRLITLTSNNYLPNIYYIKDNNDYIKATSNIFDENETYYKFIGSIKYYEYQIQSIQNDIQSCQNEILNNTGGIDKTVYGYKYVRLGTNIKFENNFDSRINLAEVDPNAIQKSGTFRLNINNDKLEVPIKGFGDKISDQDIYLRTQTKDSAGNAILGKINFLGNILGKGSIITNTGHIYASQGSVAAASFLALKSSVDRTDNASGFRYNGNKKVIEAYDITGHTFRNGTYSTNVEDYKLITLPDSNIGQIYINSDKVDENGTIDSSANNRLTFEEASNYENNFIHEKANKSLHLTVRKLDDNNLNTLYNNTQQQTEQEDTLIVFNKEQAKENQNKIFLTVEDNKIIIHNIKELQAYTRELKVFTPRDISQEELDEYINEINTDLDNLGINLEVQISRTNDDINSIEQQIIGNLENIHNALNSVEETITNDDTSEDDTSGDDTSGDDTSGDDTSGDDADKIVLLGYVNDAREKLNLCNNLLAQRNIYLQGPKSTPYPNNNDLGRWIALDFEIIDYNDISTIGLDWNNFTVVDKDKQKADLVGLNSKKHLVYWLNLDEYIGKITIELIPPIDEVQNPDKKISTIFYIEYAGITNEQDGEIGVDSNEPKAIIPIIERPQFYVLDIPDTELIKFSTQQLYLTKKEKTATFKINPRDNFIEAYRVTPSYNDTLGLVGLRFQDADVRGNTNISGTLDIGKNLTVNEDATFSGDTDIQRLTIHQETNAATILPSSKNTYNLGDPQKKWQNIYGSNGYFNDLFLNGESVTNKIPTSNGQPYQFWIGGGTGNPYWGNTLSGELYLNNNNGATGNTIPSNSSATESTGAIFRCAGAGYFGKNLSAQKVFNAVYNDYAEYRQTIKLMPGHVVIDCDNGSLKCSEQRLQPGAQVISDTFGHAMGYTENCQTPLAVAGRVLVYTYQNRNNYHAGMAVCSAPNGTVDIMTREEIKNYPDCIIGIVSEIPNYDYWGTDNIKVDNRIWIKIK